MKPKYKRLQSTLLIMTCITIGLWLILKNFNDNIVFFYSPTELIQKSVTKQVVRVGGLVVAGSIKKNQAITEFTITDNQTKLVIKYNGILPNLFRENQGIVAKGELVGDIFVASELLAKHDENYMPKEISKSLMQGKCPTCN